MQAILQLANEVARQMFRVPEAKNLGQADREEVIVAVLQRVETMLRSALA